MCHGLSGSDWVIIVGDDMMNEKKKKRKKKEGTQSKIRRDGTGRDDDAKREALRHGTMY